MAIVTQNGAVTTSATTGLLTTGTNAVATNTALRKEALDQNLRLQMTLDDVFVTFSSPVIKDTDAIPVGNEIMLNVGAEAPRGSNSISMGIIQPISGNAQYGNSWMPGTELEATLRYFKMYYGEWGVAMKMNTFGRIANEMEFLSIYEKQTPQLAHYASELEGLRIRQALLEGVDRITALDNGLYTTFNENVFIALSNNATSGAFDSFKQPKFGYTTGTAGSGLETWDQIVETAIDVGSTAKGCTVEEIRRIGYYAKYVKKIEPMENGKYILILPGNVLKDLKNNATDKAGNVFWGSYQQTSDTFNYTFKIGEIDDLIVYVDHRFPTLTSDETDITIKYVLPGNVDERNVLPYDANSNQAYSAGFLIGRAGVCKWEVTPVHGESEMSNYGKFKGNGIFGESGYARVAYDNDAGWAKALDSTPTAGWVRSTQNIGSMVVLFPNPDL